MTELSQFSDEGIFLNPMNLFYEHIYTYIYGVSSHSFCLKCLSLQKLKTFDMFDIIVSVHVLQCKEAMCGIFDQETLD